MSIEQAKFIRDWIESVKRQGRAEAGVPNVFKLSIGPTQYGRLIYDGLIASNDKALIEGEKNIKAILARASDGNIRR